MNFRALQYFVKLADLRHFSKAADACFVSQPTLSTQIKKLEEELGVQLVERSPKRIMLTPVGKEVAARARLVLNDIEQIRSVARRSSNPAEGTLRLGLFPTLAPYFLPHVVPRIRSTYPRLRLQLAEEKTEDLLAMLQSGQLDAALLALPINAEGLEIEVLFEEPFVLALPDNHSLAAHERVDFHATSMETLRQMVAADVGITLMPLLSVKPPIAATEHVVLRPFAAPAPSRTVALVWRGSSALSAFLSEFSQTLGDLPANLLKP